MSDSAQGKKTKEGEHVKTKMNGVKYKIIGRGKRKQTPIVVDLWEEMDEIDQAESNQEYAMFCTQFEKQTENGKPQEESKEHAFRHEGKSEEERKALYEFITGTRSLLHSQDDLCPKCKTPTPRHWLEMRGGLDEGMTNCYECRNKQCGYCWTRR